ncbi:hypothetical protein OF83DRAFT_1177573 [Amylostereum chailletii]|nr:hypothetical protein OF83DRAFT_1177573 [Amylostereum chailletii]
MSTTTEKLLDCEEASKLVIDQHLCRIWNIEFNHVDISPLVDHAQNKLKLSSTPINVYSALLQNKHELNANFLMFLSWLGPLAREKMKNTAGVGSLEENVLAACPSGALMEIHAWWFWCIPLCTPAGVEPADTGTFVPGTHADGGVNSE